MWHTMTKFIQQIKGSIMILFGGNPQLFCALTIKLYKTYVDIVDTQYACTARKKINWCHFKDNFKIY